MNTVTFAKMLAALTLAGATATAAAQVGSGDTTAQTAPASDRLDGSSDTTQLGEARGGTQRANPAPASADANPQQGMSDLNTDGQAATRGQQQGAATTGSENNGDSSEAEAFSSTYGSGAGNGGDSKQSEEDSVSLGGGKVKDPSEEPAGS